MIESQVIKLLLFVSAVLGLVFGQAANAGILCKRDAVITPAGEEFVKDSDPCSGSVRLQGVSYKCGQQSDVTRNTRQFLRELSANAEAYCQKMCRKRGSNCKARFTRPSECGFAVPENRSMDVGEWGPCGSHCEGQALSYCSIYHAGFLTVSEKDLEKKTPNCYCYRASDD